MDLTPLLNYLKLAETSLTLAGETAERLAPEEAAACAKFAREVLTNPAKRVEQATHLLDSHPTKPLSDLVNPSSWKWQMREKTILDHGLPLSANSTNPYLERFHLAGQRPQRYEGLRGYMTEHYSYAIPSEQALRELSPVNGKTVEIGAGNGYWAALVRARGGDIRAVDAWKGYSFHADETWTHVETTTEKVLADCADRNLFMSWPSGNGVASDALDIYLRHGGRKVIYVGEPDAEIMADEEFFATLSKEMKLTKTLPIPQWPGMKDAMFIYQR